MVTITKYVWDTVSDCVLSELDENNAVTAVYTNEPQQYGGVLSQRRGTTSHYHHHDALGSTRFLTVSVQQHHLVFRSTSAIRSCLSSALGVSSFFTSPLFAVGAVSTLILAVGADVVRMVGGPDVGAEGMVVR